MNAPRIVALCAIGLLFPLVAPGADFELPIAMVHAKVTPNVGRTLDDAVILIEKGRITAVGVGIAIPDNAQVIDAAGLFVYPGFIDANTHAGINRDEPTDDQRARLEDQNPDVRQGPQSATVQAHRRLVHPHWRAEELFDPISSRPAAPTGRFGRGGVDPSPTASDLRENFRKAGFTTALVSPKPAIFSGSSAVMQMGDTPIRRSVLRAAFAQHCALVTGANPGDFFDPSVFERPRYPTTTMGAVAAFRQMLLDAAWHRQLTEWSARHPEGPRVAFDRDLEELGHLSDEGRRVVFLANSEDEIHRALDAAAEFGLKPMLAGGREAWKAAERLKRENVPLILSLKWSTEPKAKERPKRGVGDAAAASRPSGPVSRPASSSTASAQRAAVRTPAAPDRRPIFDEEWEAQPFESQRQFEERKRLWGEEADNAKRLAEAGIRFAIGSFEMKSSADMLKNLRVAIDRGLSKDVALAALTYDAADFLGLAGSVGDIAPGRVANLTVLTKPLADEDAKVQWVFVDGKRFDMSGGEEGDGESADRGKRRKKDEARREEGSSGDIAATQTTTSAQATNSASQPVDYPDFACEIEADRKPALQTSGNLLIRGANLSTITDGDLPGTDILIQGGRIAAIGRDLTAPEATQTLDLRGYFVSPGIIDPHSHISTSGGLNEFSLSVTCEVRVRDVIDHTSVSAYRALAGGVTAIHTMHGSANTIGGQNAVLRLKYGRPSAEWLFKEAPRTVKFALGENVKQASSDRRSRGTRFPNSRAGVEGVIRRSFDAAREYKGELDDFEKDAAGNGDPRPVRRDLRLEALAEILSGDIWVHSHCYRADEILRLLTVAEDYGFRIGVLQHVLEGYRLIPEMHRHGASASTFSDWWAYKIEAFDAIPHNAARLAQGGIITTVNSDSAEVMRHLTLEAAKSLHFGGLPAGDALRLCTLNGAIQLGVEKLVGSLEVGKLGDLAVFDAHPLDTFSKCVLTTIDGEVYFQHPAMNVRAPAAPRPAKQFREPRSPLAIPASPSGAYRLVGATVYPVSGAPIEGGVVDLTDGRIVRVSSDASEPPPANATVIDCRGLRIYPGLIDAASPLGLLEIGSVQGSIDTLEIADFQPDLLALSAYNPFSSEIEVARCEGITSALIVQGGGLVSARAGLARLAGWSMPEATLRREVSLVVSLPSLPIEFPETMPEERQREARRSHRQRLQDAETFFREVGLYAKAARVSADKPELAPAPDRRFEAMIPYVRREKPVLFAADSYKQIRETLRFAERHGLRPIILGGRESWKLADELAGKKVDVIFSRTSSLPAGNYEPWDSVYRTPAMLHAAGVRFCLGVRDATLSKQLGVEAGLAVAHGLDEDAALRAITLDAARILGVAERVGSLEAGKIADLIVTTDTPLQADCCVVAVFINGRPIELSSRHTRLDSMFQSRPAPDLPAEPNLRGPPPMRLAPTR